jgi:hypothetical protein
LAAFSSSKYFLSIKGAKCLLHLPLVCAAHQYDIYCPSVLCRIPFVVLLVALDLLIPFLHRFLPSSGYTFSISNGRLHTKKWSVTVVRNRKRAKRKRREETQPAIKTKTHQTTLSLYLLFLLLLLLHEDAFLPCPPFT